MKIYVRNDLGMRKGKIGAQSAHAALSLWTNAMQYENDQLIMRGQNLSIFNQWNESGQPITIIPVNSQDDLIEMLEKNPNNSSFIVDHGRTEFKGELTPTCIAVCDNPALQSNLLKREDINTPEYNTKQAFVANKDYKMDKWSLAEHISRSAINVIFKESIFFEDEPNLTIIINNKYLKSWLLNSFPKIVLQGKENECLDLINSLEENKNVIYNISKTDNNIICVALGGDSVDKIDPYTKNFKLF